jgi:hypothetical protein
MRNVTFFLELMAAVSPFLSFMAWIALDGSWGDLGQIHRVTLLDCV